VLHDVFSMANPDALCKTGYSQEQCSTCARNTPRDYRNATLGPVDDWYVQHVARHYVAR